MSLVQQASHSSLNSLKNLSCPVAASGIRTRDLVIVSSAHYHMVTSVPRAFIKHVIDCNSVLLWTVSQLVCHSIYYFVSGVDDLCADMNSLCCSLSCGDVHIHVVSPIPHYYSLQASFHSHTCVRYLRETVTFVDDRLSCEVW